MLQRVLRNSRKKKADVSPRSSPPQEDHRGFRAQEASRGGLLLWPFSAEQPWPSGWSPVQVPPELTPLLSIHALMSWGWLEMAEFGRREACPRIPQLLSDNKLAQEKLPGSATLDPGRCAATQPRVLGRELFVQRETGS